MLNTDLLQEIKKLPLKDRLFLLEILARSVQGEISERQNFNTHSRLPRVMGILKTDNPLDLDERAIREDYAEYLIDKYS